jgi:hypothetical protein
MISILYGIIKDETSQHGIDKKYVVNSLPESIVKELERSYAPEVGLPWLILDNNSKQKFGPSTSFNKVLKYVEDDITAFRTYYTGKKGFLLIVPPGFNYQGSLDTTMLVIEKLFQKVREGIINGTSLSEDEKELIRKSLSIYLKQSFDPTKNKAEVDWQILNDINSGLNVHSLGLEGALSALGFFSGTNSGNFDTSTRLIEKLAQLINESGITNTFQSLKQKALEESLDFIIGSLNQFEDNIKERVFDAVNFFSTPNIGIKNACEGWWKELTVDIWKVLLGEEEKKEEYKIELVGNNFFKLHSKQIVVLGGDVALEVRPSQEVAWKINKTSIDGTFDNLLLREENLDPLSILQNVVSTNKGNKQKSLKFLHFGSSLFPIALDCNTAGKISAFKRVKLSNEFACEVSFNSVGSHVLTFYYHLDWALDSEIHSKENTSDHDDEKSLVTIIEPCIKGSNSIGRARAEIFADESCSYSLGVTGPNGDVYTIIIKAVSSDGDSMTVKSFYESLISENLSRKELGSKPRVVVPGGIYNLEKFLVKNKNLSFNPIAIGPDLPGLIYQADDVFDSKRNTLISSAYELDRAFDYRPNPLQNNEKFQKLISIRNQLIDAVFNDNYDGGLAPFIEGVNLVKVFSSTTIGQGLLDEYFNEYETLLVDPIVANELLWFETIILYWEKPSTIILNNIPSAVIFSPFHPVCLGWQVKTQGMLQQAIDERMPCPIAGLFSPSQVPSYWFLPRGHTSTLEFISTRTNLDYWRVFWNIEKLHELDSKEVKGFLRALNVEIDNTNISLSSNQVANTLKQVKFLLPTANNYKIGVIGNDPFKGFNMGIENWVNTQFIKGESESKGFDNAWKRVINTSLEVYDFRSEFSLPQNDVLNNLVNEKNINLSWYKEEAGNSSATFDLGVVAKLETNNSVLESVPSVVDSLLIGNGTLRLDFSLNHANTILESKKVSANGVVDSGTYEKLILGIEAALFKRTGKNVYKYNPGLSSLSNFINKSSYSVISSSGLDLSYILNYSQGQFKLWDYELPKYGKTLNSQDGYYMVSGHNEMHVSVVQDSIKRLTGSLLNDQRCQELLNWMNSLGILSLKDLATGGANSVSEVGVLVTHLIMQPGNVALGSYNGLFPVNTPTSLNFLVPIDPFRERVDMLKAFMGISDNKRPDFLLVQFDKVKVGKVYFSSIEVKTRNGDLSNQELEGAIEQASSFVEFLKKLESNQDVEADIWRLVFPVLLFEMLRFSIGLQTSNGLVSKEELELVRQVVELLYKKKGSVEYCKSWVFSISERNVSESYVLDNKYNIVGIKKQDILLLLGGQWDDFYSKCKQGFLENVRTCIPKGESGNSETAPPKTGNTPLVKSGGDIVSRDKDSRKPVSEDGNVGAIIGVGVKRDHSRDDKWVQQYKEILSILFEHGVKLNEVKEERFVEGPAFVTYKVEPGRGVKVSSVEKLHGELKLGLRLREDQRIRFKVDEGVIKIEVPKFEDDRYFVDAQSLWARWEGNPKSLEVPIGENQEGDIITMNFSSDNAPHLLIGGSTGSGKSEALNTILYGLCSYKTSDELKLLLVDPKGTELLGFENSDHLLFDIGYYPEDAITVLECAVQEMQDRYEVMKSRKVNKITRYNELEGVQKLPWWLIVLDEYGDLTSSPEDKKIIEQSLKRLAQKARAAGIHIIVTTQKPSSEVISTNIRSNLGAQLALKVRGSAESKVILDKTGADALNGRGDALFFDGVRLNRIQIALYKK